jgi:hypothetical protein
VIPLFLGIVVFVTIGVLFLAVRYRPNNSIQSGISSFRREMRALAPPPEHGPGSAPPDGRPEPEDG